MGSLKIVQINANPRTRANSPSRAGKNKKYRVKKRRKNCIVRVRKNSMRKKHETMIVGYLRKDLKYSGFDANRYYYNGQGFTRWKKDAKIFSGDAARFEAKRILPKLPPALYGIKVERV